MKTISLLLGLTLCFVMVAACISTAPPVTPKETPAPAPPTEVKTPPPKAEAPPPMLRGTPDPEIQVSVYQADSVWAGTTLLADNHNLERPRIIEVNMLGEILWQYLVPPSLKQFTNPGFDVEPLPDSNVLFVLPRNGIYEVNRKGEVVWSYQNSKVSHDADRLPNGNTLVAFGAMDQAADAQVKEINPDGRIVWEWYARDHFYKPPYKDIFDEGWTHTNAVSRLPNGNTLISLRNFNFVIEVDPEGEVVRTIGEGLFSSQHDPEILPNGNMIVVLQYRDRPHRAVEIDLKTGQPIWEFAISERNNTPVRDANRLPNGNTLITGATSIMEVTLKGDVVWGLGLKDLIFERGEAQTRGFYKAERIGTQK